MDYIKHPEFLVRVGENFRKLRLEKGISQQELSYITEISRNQIGRLERGEINCGLSTLYELSLGLKVPVYKFFEPL
jgi:transcriptional regulator with XRE-family HTH domain